MIVKQLDHINITTSKLEETKDFFLNVLGLTEGYRPDFGFSGYWLYQGDQDLVHLVGTEDDKTGSQSSSLDHFAFEGNDYDAVLETLDRHGIEYLKFDAPDGKRRQVFFRDPNDVTIEIGCFTGK